MSKNERDEVKGQNVDCLAAEQERIVESGDKSAGKTKIKGDKGQVLNNQLSAMLRS